MYDGRYNGPWMKTISHRNLAHVYLIGHFHSTECKPKKTFSVDTVDKLFAYHKLMSFLIHLKTYRSSKDDRSHRIASFV